MQHLIEAVWTNRELLKEEQYRDAIRAVIDQVDKGTLRTAEPNGDAWKVNEWVKQAILLYFGIQQIKTSYPTLFWNTTNGNIYITSI